MDTGEEDNVVLASPMMLDNIALLENGDGTFTYKEMLRVYCEREAEERARGVDAGWPARVYVQKVFTAATRMRLGAVTTHAAVSILRRLCAGHADYVRRQNPEVVVFVCLSLSAKINERRRRWVREIYADTLLACSKREFRNRELQVLERVGFCVDAPVPMHYVELLLDVYFPGQRRLRHLATNVCHLLYSAPERFIAHRPALQCAVAVLCVAQSVIDGASSLTMLSWGKSFCADEADLRLLCNVLFADIFREEKHSAFVYSV